MSRVGPAARRAGLVLLLVVGLALAGWSLASQWDDVRAGARSLTPGSVVGASTCVVLSLTSSLLAWRTLLAGLGVVLPLGTAARVYFVGQLGKYVPGSVWPVMAQMELGARYGLSRPAVGVASLLVMGIAVPVALLLGLLAVPALVSADGSAYLLVFLALPVGLAVLWPPLLNRLLERGLRLLRRPPLPQRLELGTVVRVAGFAAAAQVLFGGQVWLLARALGADGDRLLLLCIGAFALASVAGLLALPVPAGAGVREAVLVLTMSPALPTGKALLLALLSRVLLTLGDLVVAAASSRGLSRSAETPSPPEDDRAPRSSS